MDPFQKFYDRALRFLSYRPRSEKEIVDYLKRPRGRKKEKVDEKVIAKILNKLKEHNFVNDEEFARWWVEQRTGAKPKGFRLIKIELQQKGIDKETIEKILGEYDTKILGADGARRLLVKALPRYKKLPRLALQQKLSQFLLRRGFEWDTVKGAIDEIVEKEYNTKR